MKRLAKLILLLLVLVFLAVLDFQPVVVAGMLIGGWIGYLRDVLPKVQVNRLGVASFIVLLVLTIGLFQLFATWLFRELTQRRWKFGWTLISTAIMLLMFTAGLAAVGITHQSAWLATAPMPLFRGHEIPNRIHCAANMQTIGQMVHRYARDHQGNLPDSLPDLWLAYHDYYDVSVFTCPDSSATAAPGKTVQEQADEIRHFGRYESYIYHGAGLHEPVAADFPILAEPLIDHSFDGVNVLFGDGHVEFLNAQEAEEVMRRVR